MRSGLVVAAGLSLGLCALGNDAPVISRDSILTSTVRRGDLIRKVDCYGVVQGLEAVLEIPLSALSEIRTGQSSIIDLRQGLTHGSVVQAEPGGPPDVRVKLDALPAGAKSGDPVAASILTEELKDVLLLEATPLLPPDSTVSVFRLDKDGNSATRVEARTGKSFSGRVEVRRGLSEGDVVILSQPSVPKSVDRVVIAARPNLTIQSPSVGVPSSNSYASPAVVDAGGYMLRMLIEGAGPRNVVFINGGFGGQYETWHAVAEKVRTFSRVVLYDRGGTGHSMPAPPPRDSKHIAQELRTALINARIPPPYVLVGQSLGGLHARVFAHEFPKDVAGLVLIDPTHEDYNAELVKARGPEAQKNIDLEKAAMDREFKQLPSGMRYEYESLSVDYDEARAAWPLPEVPLTVLTSLHRGTDLNHDSPMIWLAMHDDLVSRVPGAKHIISNKLGHNMHNEDPAFVADAIRDVVHRAFK